MRYAVKLITAAGIASLLATPALASGKEGWYFGGEVGASLPSASKYRDATTLNKVEADTGYGLNGQVGYDFGSLRVEGELGWRQNGVKKVGATSGGANGNTNVATLMANVYYDVALGMAVVPYFGVGMGVANVSADNIKKGGAKLYNGDDTAIAGQAIVGVAYPLTDSLALKADYRYLRTSEARVTETGKATKARVPYSAHALMIGFNYKFGGDDSSSSSSATATPLSSPILRTPASQVAAVSAVSTQAPQAVQPAVIRSYLVFFDFDKVDLTPEAEKIVTQAADNAKAAKVTNLRLVGHTDTTGSEKYNMALSLRRANIVKTALVKRGIPAEDIAVIGKGKSEPLVQTGDGVREPQNRRVQIILP